MRLCIGCIYCIPYESHSIKFAPWFQTAGFGVFAGRAFKKDETVLRSWMTLLLPRNIPPRQSPRCYVFAHNKTHSALDLDYGSIINHHESANARATGVDNMHYRVRGNSMCDRNVQKLCSIHKYRHKYIHKCIHTYIHTYIHAYMHTDMHTDMHTYMHTYTSIHT